MKKSFRISRKNFEPQLRGYSTTAGPVVLAATAATLMTATLRAQTAITSFNIDGAGFSSTPTLMSGNANHTFIAKTAGGDGLVGAFHVRFSPGYYGKVRLFHTGLIAGFTGTVFNLPGSVRIDNGGVNLAPQSVELGDLIAIRSASFNGGSFVPNSGASQHKSGYIGFKTSAHNKYGWLKIRVTNSGEGLPVSVAFVTASNGLYGQLGASSMFTPSAIPEPASVAAGLALFALGAVGVREHRRRKKLAA